jgi:hypothetical protein
MGGFDEQAAHFTSEEEARKNEQTMARSLVYEKFMAMIEGDLTFYDLSKPDIE